MHLIRVVWALAAALALNAAPARAQAPVTPGQPPPQVVPPEPATPAPTDLPAPGAPGTQAPGVPGTQTPAVPGPPAPAVAPVAPPVGRVFAAPTGMLFNSVRPDRVADFEAVLWYLQQALRNSTDPTVRAQADGWRMFRATEPGPNGTVVFVFLLDPAVAKADYGLGRILADAYPEKIQEIWRLYQGSVTGGGSLLNLTPVEPMEPLPLTAPATTPPAPARTPPPGP